MDVSDPDVYSLYLTLLALLLWATVVYFLGGNRRILYLNQIVTAYNFFSTLFKLYLNIQQKKQLNSDTLFLSQDGQYGFCANHYYCNNFNNTCATSLG